MPFVVSKYRNRVKKRFEIEVVTPLFLGGAGKKEAELRETAFKGMLRFWWRALYGGSDIGEMKKREDLIFGSTSSKSDLMIKFHDTYQCQKSTDPFPGGQNIRVNARGRIFHINILNYLSYGTQEQQKEYFIPGTRFNVELNFSADFNDEILDSLNIFAQFGGVGSRSRNGFGAFEKKDLNFILSSNYETMFDDELKNYTSFSKYSKIFRFPLRNSWTTALSDAGIVYREARLSLGGQQRNKRQLIAQPITQWGINDRHAKPYFLHVNRLKDGQYRGQILFLPYLYHKKSERGAYTQACSDMNRVIGEKAETVLGIEEMFQAIEEM